MQSKTLFCISIAALAFTCLTTFSQPESGTGSKILLVTPSEKQFILKNFTPESNVTQKDFLAVKEMCQSKYGTITVKDCLTKLVASGRHVKNSSAIFFKVGDDSCGCNSPCEASPLNYGTYLSNPGQCCGSAGMCGN